MSELMILKSLVLAQQEALSQLREENNQVQNENKRLKKNSKYTCDNRCSKVGYCCQNCETRLCEECEISCTRCGAPFCQPCSENLFKLTCKLCDNWIIICRDCWEEDLSFHCYNYMNGIACHGVFKI